MKRRRGGQERRPFLYVTSARSVILGALLLAVLIASGFLGEERAPTAFTGPLSGQTVYIDPGHGGIDPGACGQFVVEKDVVLKVALYLGVRLEKSGARVVYSRTGDYDLEMDGKDDVEERVKLIESSGATIVISLHCNAFTDPAEYGAQTFYNSDKHPESKRLAEIVQAILVEETDTEREASARIDHFILNASSVPSVTVELGFLSSPREEELLGSPDYQQKLAECLRRAIIEFAEGPLG